ncbi:PTS sugar transporter subunit IIC [Shimazuella alba]|uniref:Permease IIC component n=1 Tax=Shimazuella alba TaxID=2690964 RepID=A0A6I4W4K1_9BACL|nr:PTS sugar transporter subunit IIC [Shimazuella alba]MXQ55232.1 PTS transporter subunit EIIC [Shimazuella alba]
MEKILKFLEEKILPFAHRLAAQRHLGALRDGFITLIPLLIVGSIFLIIQNFPIPGWDVKQVEWFGAAFPDLITMPAKATFDLLSLYVVFAISYRLAQYYKIDAITTGILSLVSYIIIAPTTLISESNEVISNVIPMGEWFGSKGLLVAIIIAILVTEIYNFFLKRKIVIKMPEQVPPTVARAFSALIPAFTIFSLMLLIKVLFLQTSYHSLNEFIYVMLAKPITLFIANNIFGALATTISITMLWSIGINSGSLVNGVLRPFWLDLQKENIQAIQAGQPLPNIITEQFFDMIWIGGAGATLVVAIILIFRARSRQFKELGRIAGPPGLFNINEPILFGLPIILSPIMLIPFNLAPIVITIVNYFAMYFDLVARPTGVVLPWTTPPIIQGFMITNSWTGAVLQVVDMIIAGLIYYPFIKIIDRQKYKEETSEN